MMTYLPVLLESYVTRVQYRVHVATGYVTCFCFYIILDGLVFLLNLSHKLQSVTMAYKIQFKLMPRLNYAQTRF